MSEELDILDALGGLGPEEIRQVQEAARAKAEALRQAKKSEAKNQDLMAAYRAEMGRAMDKMGYSPETGRQIREKYRKMGLPL